MHSFATCLSIPLLSLIYGFCMPGDQCTPWEAWQTNGKNSGIYLQICENPDGTSAYYHFKNTTAKAVRISFSINHKNGKSTKGSVQIKAKTQGKDALCTLCATRQGGGNNTWKLTKIAFEGEAGFW